MFHLIDMPDVLSPLALMTVFISGLLVGFIYVKRITNIAKFWGYHVTVLATAFLVVLGTVRYLEGTLSELEEWIAAFILFGIYMLGIRIGIYKPKGVK